MTFLDRVDLYAQSISSVRKLALVADAAEEFFSKVVVVRDAVLITDTLTIHIDAPTWYVLKRRVAALRSETP